MFAWQLVESVLGRINMLNCTFLFMTWISLSRAGFGLKMEKSRNSRNKGKYYTIYALKLNHQLLKWWPIWLLLWGTKQITGFAAPFFGLWLSLDFGKYFCYMTFTFILWKVVVEGVKFTRKEEWPIKFEPWTYILLDLLLQNDWKTPQHFKVMGNFGKYYRNKTLRPFISILQLVSAF